MTRQLSLHTWLPYIRLCNLRQSTADPSRSSPQPLPAQMCLAALRLSTPDPSRSSASVGASKPPYARLHEGLMMRLHNVLRMPVINAVNGYVNICSYTCLRQLRCRCFKLGLWYMTSCFILSHLKQIICKNVLVVQRLKQISSYSTCQG